MAAGRVAGDPIAGRYLLEGVIGVGGVGEVWAATDTLVGGRVAVKLLRDEIAADPRARRRFAAEALAARKLVHPHVVAVLDTGDPDPVDAPHIVMELMSGRTGREALAAGPMEEWEVRDLALHVLSGLGAAHAAGIVHRDVKPGNILSTPGGCWKIGDFGIAKSAGVPPSDETVTGLVTGTPAYIAPERMYGRPASPVTDLFSLGVVLYEALAGRRPYATFDAYPWSQAAGGLRAEPLAEACPGVHPGLAAVVERAIDLREDRRFVSAAEMAAAIVVSARAPRFRRAAPAAASGCPVLPDGVASQRRPAAKRWILSPRRLRLAVAGLATVAAASALMVVLVLRTGATPAGSRLSTRTPSVSATSTTTIPPTAPPGDPTVARVVGPRP